MTQINTDCKFALFFYCNKSIFNTDKDVLLSFVYLPPQRSQFYNSTEFSGIMLFEDVFVGLPIFDKYLLIMGDFNGRIGELKDTFETDKFVKELEEYSDVFDNFDLPRKSKDKLITLFGRRLIDFCRIYSIYIANGRVGNDKNIGNFTYIGAQGCSVIDYVIMSADLFNITENFDIDNRTESSHLPLVIMSKEHARPRVVEMTQLNDETSFFYSRKSTDIDTFVQNMSRFCQSEDIQSLYVDITNHDKNVEDIIRQIIHTFQETAVKHKRTVKPEEQSPWFDKECKDERQTKYKTLRRFRKNGTSEDLNAYLSARSNYKTLLKQKKEEFNNKQIDSLIDCINESKSFWGKFKQLLGKKRKNNLGNISQTEWKNYFQALFTAVDDNEIPEALEKEEPGDEIEYLNFNSEITIDEILNAVNSLKIDKSPGPDGLFAEFFKQSIDVILPLLNSLFNRLFLSGMFPESWSKSVITPLYKKGVNNPEHFRGLSLLDVIGKIYTSILNRRITFYVNMYGKISEAQFGFREGYSTIDNAFILNSIIERYLAKKKGKIYVCFVDFKRAFDSVNRQKLWSVLKTNGLKGNLFKVVKSMYESVKACVRINGECTDYFECTEGLRQGCLLSPVLFSMFVNEFTKIIETSGFRGIQLFPELIELFLLLFADDIALISDTKSGLQGQLSLLSPFCKEYKIRVHIGKTKIVVIRNGGR